MPAPDCSTKPDPFHDATLRTALKEAESTPELQPLVAILDHATTETVGQ